MPLNKLDMNKNWPHSREYAVRRGAQWTVVHAIWGGWRAAEMEAFEIYGSLGDAVASARVFAVGRRYRLEITAFSNPQESVL